MNESSRRLDRIQRWMQSVITHPSGIEAGIQSPEACAQIDVAPAAVEDVVLRSQALDSIRRLEVYGNAYYARLMECLRDQFPVLVYALDEELFNEFAFSYLQLYPSQSYTLNRLADHFVEFLEETRPDLVETSIGEMDTDDAGASAAKPGVGWPDFLIDIARLEWTIDQVFDGPGVEDEKLLTADDLLAIPPDRWPDARLVPVVCLKLLAFRYPVNDYYTAFRNDEQPAMPEPEATYAAITRREYIVRRFPLSQPQFELLSSLAAGETVGSAIAAVAESTADFDSLADNLRDWFHTWAIGGFFHHVELAESPALDATQGSDAAVQRPW